MKAAIFDMDGLIIDSEPLWRLAEREAFSRVGLDLSDDECRLTTGLRSDEVVGYWFERRPWTGVGQGAVVRDLETRVSDLIASRGRALPGVFHAIDLLRGAGLRLAIASSSSHEIIRVVLSTLRLDDGFEFACSAADEERGKPDPAVYNTTVGRLGVSPAEVVAIEDSVAGVQAAHAAGIFVVAVPAAADFDDPRYEVADLKLPSLAEFNLQLIDPGFSDVRS